MNLIVFLILTLCYSYNIWLTSNNLNEKKFGVEWNISLDLWPISFYVSLKQILDLFVACFWVKLFSWDIQFLIWKVWITCTFPLKGTQDPTEPGRKKQKPQGDYVAISDIMLQMGKLRHIFYHRLDKFASTLRSFQFQLHRDLISGSSWIMQALLYRDLRCLK
jgi:hypothetical protein